MNLTIIAAVDTFTYRELKILGMKVTTGLWLSAIYRHLVEGTINNGEIAISRVKTRELSRGPGILNPCTYVAVGPVIHFAEVSHQTTSVAKGFDIIMDAGIPIDIRQRYQPEWKPRAPKLVETDLQVGDWVAVMGNLHLAPWHNTPEHQVTCELQRALLLDIRPSSETFGSVIEWPIGLQPPFDPDVLPFPTLFVELSIG